MPDRPHILVLMTDQQRGDCLSCAGHPCVRTPNMDQLAAEGVRFQAAYSNCPVCGPARGALLSGQYVSNCRVYDNAAAWPQDMVTLPHYLTLAGYDTVLSGKMHFVGADQLLVALQNFGCDPIGYGVLGKGIAHLDRCPVRGVRVP